MPKKPKAKVKKIRAIRQPRAPAKAQTNIINVYTDRQEPYRTDFKNQFRYGLGNVAMDTYNPFSKNASTTYVEPQTITESLRDIPSKELTSKSIFQPFGGLPKKKLNIGEQVELQREFINLASSNPYGSESESSFVSRKSRSDIGKARGSSKEKAIIEGRNIQNVFALRAGSGGETSEGGEPVYTTSKLGTSGY
jgi:hypothetical protein